MSGPDADLFREISGLAEKSLRGELTDDEAARLERLVLQDPQARRLYVRYVHETQSLRAWTAASSQGQGARSIARRTRRDTVAGKTSRIAYRTVPARPSTPNLLGAGIAAALVVGLGLAALQAPSRRNLPPEERREWASPSPEPDPESPAFAPPPRRPRPNVERPKGEPKAALAARAPSEEPRPAPPPPEPPRPPRENPAAETARPTVPAPAPRSAEPGIARIESVSGEVHRLQGSRKLPAEEGQTVTAGSGIETAAGSARVAFPDGTRIRLDPGTSVPDLHEKKGKQVTLQRGTLHAEVTRQAPEHPLRIRTPHAEAVVLGTTLRLAVEDHATHVAVSEGRVRLSRPSQRGSVEVSSGQQAVAAAGGGMWSGPSPLREIVIPADQARLVGNRWRFVLDPLAIGGKALEAPHVLEMDEGRGVFLRGDDFAEFVFPADAEVTYHVWIRGRCTATERQGVRDAVTLFPLQARVVRYGTWPVVPERPGLGFNGFSHEKAYWWIGGDADTDGPGGSRRDTVPTSLRFDRSGLQRVRLIPFEGPIRIDALWLSASQETRPAREQKGPR